MQIQPLSPSENAETIQEQLALLFVELFGPDAVLSDEQVNKTLAEWQKRKHNHWAFAGRDEHGRVVAFFTLAESFAFFAHGAYGILNELWVIPECRSEGLGLKVVEYIEAFAKQRGWERIDVSAPPLSKWDRTFAFYEKRGFVFTGRKLKFLLGQE